MEKVSDCFNITKIAQVSMKAAQEVIQGKELKVIKCPKHINYDFVVFCRTCNRLVCPKCLTLDHQQHIMCDIQTIHVEKQEILSKNQFMIMDDFIPYVVEKSRKLEKLLQNHEKHFETKKQRLGEQEEKFMREI